MVSPERGSTCHQAKRWAPATATGRVGASAMCPAASAASTRARASGGTFAASAAAFFCRRALGTFAACARSNTRLVLTLGAPAPAARLVPSVPAR